MPGNKSNLLHLHSHSIHSIHSYSLKPPETGPAQNRPSQTSALQEKHTRFQQKLVYPAGEQTHQCYSKSIKLNHSQELVHTKKCPDSLQRPVQET